MSRIMHLPKFKHFNCELKKYKTVEWSMTCQHKDEDTEKWCDFHEKGSRQSVEAASLHHLLTKRGHSVIIFKKVCFHYFISEKR